MPKCVLCNGTGKIEAVDFSGMPVGDFICRACNGSGQPEQDLIKIPGPERLLATIDAKWWSTRPPPPHRIDGPNVEPATPDDIKMAAVLLKLLDPPQRDATIRRNCAPLTPDAMERLRLFGYQWPSLHALLDTIEAEQATPPPSTSSGTISDEDLGRELLQTASPYTLINLGRRAKELLNIEATFANWKYYQSKCDEVRKILRVGSYGDMRTAIERLKASSAPPTPLTIAEFTERLEGMPGSAHMYFRWAVFPCKVLTLSSNTEGDAACSLGIAERVQTAGRVLDAIRKMLKHYPALAGQSLTVEYNGNTPITGLTLSNGGETVLVETAEV